MRNTQDSFTDITDDQLEAVSGGAREATSPSSHHQDRTIGKIERELAGMSGGGDMMMMMMMMMQMASKGQGEPISEVCSPGLVGAILGGTTKMR
jgi:hypothetical protein